MPKAKHYEKSLLQLRQNVSQFEVNCAQQLFSLVTRNLHFTCLRARKNTQLVKTGKYTCSHGTDRNFTSKKKYLYFGWGWLISVSNCKEMVHAERNVSAHQMMSILIFQSNYLPLLKKSMHNVPQSKRSFSVL